VNDHPLISIIITTSNRCELLPRAINSAINQTYKNIEIIIINDASVDQTENIIKEYQKLYSNIIYIKNDVPSGANVSRNKGINIARGKFIAGLDDDDEFLHNRIELLLKNYDEKYAFVTSLNIIKTDNELNYSKCPKIVTLKHMKKDNILMNQAFIEKSRILKIGSYDEELSAYQDYDMWIRLILEYGKVKVLQEYTQKVYFETNRKRISTNIKKRFYGYFRFYKKHKELFSEIEKKNFLSIFYIIRNKKVSLKTFFTIKTDLHEISLLHILDTSRFQYQAIINLYETLNQLDKGEKYILYGYGSVGKLILPLIKDNIVGIIDKNLSTNTIIEGIPIIGIHQIKDLTKNILLSPFIHKRAILKDLKNIDCKIINIF
jgi:glycosyltransferase involved in cell wall biosynthesis